MGRTFVLAFLGEAKGAANHAHESPANMTTPLVILGLGAIGVGWCGHFYAERIGYDYHFHLAGIGVTATLIGLLGLGLAWALYSKRRHEADQVPLLQGLSRFVSGAYVDRAFSGGFRGVALPVARGIGWFDRYVIDGIINFIGWIGLASSRLLRRAQTGNTLDYLAAVVVGTLLVILLGIAS